MADVARLQRRFAKAAEEHVARSPFNAHLLERIAITPEIAGLLAAAPEEQQLPVLLLAAVHSLVLAEPDAELAAWYPTVSVAPRTDDAFAAFARFCGEHDDELRTIIATHSTQTNEIGRCAAFVPALASLGAEVGELALVDVGTSAGLNLALDRYRYEYDGDRDGRAVGPASPVTLRAGVRGDPPIPDDLPTIADRIGIDRAPIDLDDPERVRWLMACVWPDQRDRFERLHGAIELARAHPAPIVTGDAVTQVAAAVQRVAGGGHPTVVTSWVLNYLTPTERSAFVAELDRIGGDRDLSWLLFESPGMCHGIAFPDAIRESFRTHLVLARWRDGRFDATPLAECHPHGYWLHWHADA
jgi:hypothetical protein